MSGDQLSELDDLLSDLNLSFTNIKNFVCFHCKLEGTDLNIDDKVTFVNFSIFINIALNVLIARI